MTGGGSPRCLRAMRLRSLVSVRTRDAALMRSRRDSRDSIPWRAVRMSFWRRERERARRRRFSERVEREGFPFVSEDWRVGEGGLLADGESGWGGEAGWDCCEVASTGSGGLFLSWVFRFVRQNSHHLAPVSAVFC